MQTRSVGIDAGEVVIALVFEIAEVVGISCERVESGRIGQFRISNI